MNKTISLILIVVSSCVLCVSRFSSSATATSVQLPSADEQRPVPPASCPLTLPPAVLFTPPGEREMSRNDNSFWLGTERLWIALPKAGQVWGWAPRLPGHEHDLTAKIFWGSVDFDYRRKEDYGQKSQDDASMETLRPWS